MLSKKLGMCQVDRLKGGKKLKSAKIWNSVLKLFLFNLYNDFLTLKHEVCYSNSFQVKIRKMFLHIYCEPSYTS